MRLKHPASFSTNLPKRLIEVYTKPRVLVLTPFVFVANKVHEYVLIFRKPKAVP
jgi:hypothetical protein